MPRGYTQELVRDLLEKLPNVGGAPCTPTTLLFAVLFALFFAPNKLFNGAFSAGFTLLPLFTFDPLLLFVAGGLGEVFPNGIKLLNESALFFLLEFEFAGATAFITAFIAPDAACATAFTAPIMGLDAVGGAGNAFISN